MEGVGRIAAGSQSLDGESMAATIILGTGMKNKPR
jgi:hypothetical protein